VDKVAKGKGVSEEAALKDILEGDAAAEEHYDEEGEGGRAIQHDRLRCLKNEW
jgi:hypothetical protein